MPSAIWMTAPIAFAFFTPLGLFWVYLLASGWPRVVSWWIAEPHGDPVLTGVDWLVTRTRRTTRERSVSRARLEAEGAAEPDRLYPGTWAELPDVDLVGVVIAPEAPAGTKARSSSRQTGWYTLGEPFDRRRPGSAFAPSIR